MGEPFPPPNAEAFRVLTIHFKAAERVLSEKEVAFASPNVMWYERQGMSDIPATPLIETRWSNTRYDPVMAFELKNGL